MTRKIDSTFVEVLGYEFTVFANTSPDYDGTVYRNKVLVYCQSEQQAIQILNDHGYTDLEVISRNPYPGNPSSAERSVKF